MKKPNILLITTDTQRWDTLRCMGSPFAISPHLDRLAAEGVMFDNAHTSSPVCSPARCCLLTGLHTPVHGCIENGTKRNEHLSVFPDYLKQQGYTNIIVGKAHFGDVPDSFDIQRVLGKDGKDENRDDFYDRHLKQHGYTHPEEHPHPVPEELYLESFLVDTTIEEIKQAVDRNDGPFFAFCSMIAPHGPFTPPGKWAALYDDVPLPELNYTPGEIESFPEHMKRLLGFYDKKQSLAEQLSGLKDADSEISRRIDQQRRLYYGFAAYCDAQVGRLIDYLDQSGLRENTLVIFTSDHGTQLYDHGFSDKHNYYDASWRIPFIMSMPGTLPQGETRDFAIWNDITATILGAAGTQCGYMQGFDLFSALASGEESPRRCAVATLYKSAALATKRWKLEYYFEEGIGRMYDRVKDPLEQNDLFADDHYEKVKNELAMALLTWRADLSDLQTLIEGTKGGGPVAKRIAPHTKLMKGTDAEERLNQWAERIDQRFSDL